MKNFDFSNKRALLFDMDGTLIDSMGIWHEIDVEFCERHGIIMPPDLQKRIEGLSFFQTAEYFIAEYHMDVTPEALMQEWTQMAYSYYTSGKLLKKGAYNFLLRAKEKGFALGIATSNGKELAIAALQAHGIANLFSCVLTSKEVPNGKPAPDIYLGLAKELSVEPEDCVVFEDIIPGITAGKSAGMQVITIEDTYSHDIRAKKEMAADLFIEDFDEIYDSL